MSIQLRKIELKTKLIKGENSVPIRDLLERDELIFGKKIELLHTF